MHFFHNFCLLLFFLLYGSKRFRILLFSPGVRVAETIKNIFFLYFAEKVIKIFKQKDAITVPQLIIRYI